VNLQLQYTADGTVKEHNSVLLGYDAQSDPRKKKRTPQSHRHENVKARTDLEELWLACRHTTPITSKSITHKLVKMR